MYGRKLLLALIVVVVLAVAVTAVGVGHVLGSSGRVSAITNIAPKPRAHSKRSKATTAPDSRANPAASGPTVRFHGLTIQLPKEWKPGPVVPNEQHIGSSANDQGIVDGRPCHQSRFGRDCPGFMLLLNPMADPDTMYQPNTGWAPGTDQEGCPMDRNHLAQYWENAETPKVHKVVTVGGETALYNEFTLDCGRYASSYGAPGYVKYHYTQRVWYVAVGGGDVIVIVDEWSTPGLSKILERSTWNIN